MKEIDFKSKFLAQWDNPSTEHDARSILSPFKVGVWLTFFNICVVLGTLITFYALPNDSSFRRLIGVSGMGSCLTSTVQLVLVAFFTLVLPLRAAGLLESPRWSGYFDQIVCTGITPARFFYGKWLSSQAFILIIMGASLPYAILFSFFAESGHFHTLVVYLEIYVYANFLLVVTFALGMFIYEWLAFLIVTLTFGSFILMEMFSPMPSAIAMFTPARSIVSQYVNHILTSSGDRKLLFFFGDPQLFSLGIPDELYRIAIWLFHGAIAVAYVLIGPRHFFSKGLNNFDGVVLPGDSRRAMIFRTRPLLTRRLQLSFFYENRSPWLIKHDLPIRALLRFLLMAAGLFIGIGTILSTGCLSYIKHGTGVAALLLTAWFHVVVSHTIWTLRVRSDFRQKWKTPFGFHLDVVSFDFATMIAMLILSFALVTFGTAIHSTELKALRYSSFDGNIVGPGSLVTFVLEWMLISVIYLLSVQIVSKLMGLASLSRVVVFIFVKLYMTVSLLGPLVIGAIAMAMGRSRFGAREDPSIVLQLFASLAHFSPIARFMVTTENGRRPFGDSIIGTHGYWFYQPVWLILLTLALIWKLRRRPKDFSETLEGPAPLPDLLKETVAAKEKKIEKVTKKEAQSDTSVVSLERTSSKPVLKAKLATAPAQESQAARETPKEVEAVRPDTETISLDQDTVEQAQGAAKDDSSEDKGESK